MCAFILPSFVCPNTKRVCVCFCHPFVQCLSQCHLFIFFTLVYVCVLARGHCMRIHCYVCVCNVPAKHYTTQHCSFQLCISSLFQFYFNLVSILFQPCSMCFQLWVCVCDIHCLVCVCVCVCVNSIHVCLLTCAQHIF